jgi:hypothetical protein
MESSKELIPWFKKRFKLIKEIKIYGTEMLRATGEINGYGEKIKVTVKNITTKVILKDGRSAYVVHTKEDSNMELGILWAYTKANEKVKGMSHKFTYIQDVYSKECGTGSFNKIGMQFPNFSATEEAMRDYIVHKEKNRRKNLAEATKLISDSVDKYKGGLTSNPKPHFNVKWGFGKYDEEKCPIPRGATSMTVTPVNNKYAEYLKQKERDTYTKMKMEVDGAFDNGARSVTFTTMEKL